MADRLEPGTRLGRYRTERLLGTGGMGEAYLAIDEVIDVPVVLKVLSKKVQGDSAAFTRFKREVLLSRKIAHPRVCKVFDLHQEDELWFLSMEYVEGETLEAVMAREESLPIGEAVRITLQLCDGLAAAHEAGVVHRDLKPANIMLRPGRELSILDFGLAIGQDNQRVTRVGTFVGTAHYVAPEVARGQQATEQSDLYAVGALLYRMVTGDVPFDGANIMEICRAVIQDDCLPPSALNPELEPDLERVILKAMEKDPAKRYANVRDIQVALESATLSVPGTEVQVHSQPQQQDASAAEMEAVVGYSAVLRAQQRQTTLLFSDIVEITPFFERYGDIEGRKKIEKHNRLLFPIIEAHQGRVVKTIGDAIMAFFELPDEGLEAAIEMQEALERHNATVAEPDFRIEIRIGVNSGEAIVEADDVYGDAVNVASRVSSRAAGSQILVSQATVDCLEMEWDELVPMGTFQLKGKAEPVRIYFLRWKAGLEVPQRAAPPSPAPPPAPRADRPAPVAAPAPAPTPAPTEEQPGLIGSLRLPHLIGAFVGLLVLAVGLGWLGSRLVGGGQPTVTRLPTPDPAQPAPDPAVPAPTPTPDPVPPTPTPTPDPVVPTPTPTPTPTPDPVDPPPGDLQPEDEGPTLTVDDTLATLLNARGILPDDDPTLEQILIKMNDATGRKRARLGRQAFARADKLVIDETFVRAKLLRLEVKVKSRGLLTVGSRQSEYLMRAREAIRAGKYEHANQLLNAGFRSLKRSR
ncbi:MAG: protein kinase [Deltaproteobacteria bacterium]|nr:protein kinase [Deltaproteobacteria bacterium]